MNPTRLPRETTTRDLLSILFRRKLVIGVVLVLATLISTGRSLRAPVVYWSYTQVLLQGAQRTSALETRVVFRPWEEVVNSEVNIAVSDQTIVRAKAILARRRSTPEKEVRPEDIRIQRGRLEAVPVSASTVFWIKYGGETPEDAREVVTAMTEAYLEIHRELYRLPDARVMLEGTLTETEEALRALNEERRNFLIAEGFFAGDREKEDLSASLERNRADLLALDTEIAGQEERIHRLREALALGDPENFPHTEDAVSTASRLGIARIKEELVRLRAQRGDLLSRFQEGHREVVAVNDAIAAMREQLRQATEVEISEQQSALEVLQARRASLLQGAEETKGRLARIPELEAEVRDYDRQIQALTEYYLDFQRGEYSLTLSEVTGRDFEAILLSPASKPQAKDPRDLVRLSLGPGLGLLAGIGLALFLERMDHSVHTPQDVEEYLDLPVLASVSDTPWEPASARRWPWSRTGT